MNNRSTGSDVDRQKLQESTFFAQPSASFRHGVVYGPRQQQVPHYRIGVPLRRRCACWRRSREAQRRLIRDGEAMPIENHLQLNDETEESQPDSGEEE